MEEQQRQYVAIDLKSFYASVECVDRGLDPMSTNLVVADSNRTDKTICLAVSPSLKALGIGGRPRLFEVVQSVEKLNRQRTKENRIRYIVAQPRMARYIEVSTQIYSIYLKYIACEDIHVYSIDEVFMDVTKYLKSYELDANQLAMTIIRDVLKNTGITATAGIGTNMYLAKVAMDIVAKHIPANEDGVRIAQLDEKDYRRKLWNHRPITSFWRVGRGIAEKLEKYGIYTMGNLARLSLTHEDFLYNLFGANAELLIDHAWGWESCTIDIVKSYQPEHHSFSSGQVLQSPYTWKKALVVVQEMVEGMALNLVSRRMVTNQMELTIGYASESLANTNSNKYQGDVKKDYYGRLVPKHAHGTANLKDYTSSTLEMTQAVVNVYNNVVNPNLLIRRINITVNNVVYEDTVSAKKQPEQLDLFTNYDEQKRQKARQKKERRMQEAQIAIKKRFGKNAILRGLNWDEGATAKERNKQIGGHKA